MVGFWGFHHVLVFMKENFLWLVGLCRQYIWLVPHETVNKMPKLCGIKSCINNLHVSSSQVTANLACSSMGVYQLGWVSPGAHWMGLRELWTFWRTSRDHVALAHHAQKQKYSEDQSVLVKKLISYFTIEFTVVYCGILWYTVVYCGTLWYTVIYCGILWYTVVYCDILWYTVIYCGTLWYTVIYCDTLWWCSVH